MYTQIGVVQNVSGEVNSFKRHNLDVKEKITHLKDNLEEFVTTKEVLK